MGVLLKRDAHLRQVISVHMCVAVRVPLLWVFWGPMPILGSKKKSNFDISADILYV